MTRIAPRISRRLVDAIDLVDDEREPIAETVRRIGAYADRVGLPRPSYQRLRVLVHESRRLRRIPSTTDVVLETWLRARPPDDLVRHLSGENLRPLR